MDYEKEIDTMIETIQMHSVSASGYTGIKKISDNVINAMRSVPRHEFIPEPNRIYAYDDSALPIGHGQTISQPYIVALMCDILRLNSDDKVLEIGTGCGYASAVLSKLCKHVYTVEILQPLAVLAMKNLVNYPNITVSCRNGYDGFKEHAPFDAITVAAAADKIPESLIKQLAPGGRMIIPVSYDNAFGQRLVLAEKSKTGHVTSRDILPVVFVPFVKA
jgi:protein-L-isoaspartate(D-aspartate) O-methyltransferase